MPLLKLYQRNLPWYKSINSIKLTPRVKKLLILA